MQVVAFHFTTAGNLKRYPRRNHMIGTGVRYLKTFEAGKAFVAYTACGESLYEIEALVETIILREDVDTSGRKMRNLPNAILKPLPMLLQDSAAVPAEVLIRTEHGSRYSEPDFLPWGQTTDRTFGTPSRDCPADTLVSS